MRIIAIILSIACGGAFWYWASQPVWSATGYTSTQHLGYDDQRQVLYSMVERDQRWWIERHDLSTGALVSKVPVDVPATVVGNLGCVRNYYLGHGNADVTVVGTNGSTAACFHMEIATGKCTPIKHDNAWYLTACSGNRCAILDTIRTVIDVKERVYTADYGILLIECEPQKSRRLKLDTFPYKFAIFDRYLIVAIEKELQLLDWNTAEVISRQKISGSPHYQISVSRKGSIYLFFYDSTSRLYFQRFQISNSTLQPCGSVSPLPVTPFQAQGQLGAMVLEEDDKGNIHVACYFSKTWPRLWRTMFNWLSQRGWKIDNYIPISMLYAKYVVNANDQVIDHYETPYWTQRFILEQFQIVHQDSIIQVFKTSAVWPNAMAVAMVVYLGFYVWRHRQVNVNNVVDMSRM